MNLYQNENTKSLTMALHENSNGWVSTSSAKLEEERSRLPSNPGSVPSVSRSKMRSPPRSRQQQQCSKVDSNKSMPTIDEDIVATPTILPATSHHSTGSTSTTSSRRYSKKVKRKRTFVLPSTLNMTLPYPASIDGVLVPDSRWSHFGRRGVDDVPPKMPSRAVQRFPTNDVEDVHHHCHSEEIDCKNEIVTASKLNRDTVDKLEENLRYLKSMFANKDKKRRKLVIVRPLVQRSSSALACMQSTAPNSCGRESSSSTLSLRHDLQGLFGQRSWYSL